MCLGNRAENSAAYINSQFLVQWRNAQRCTEHYGKGLKPEYKEVEYGTALYEFYGPGKSNRYRPSKQDYSFHAHFGVPRIDFVCNHEVVLYIDIRNGHYSTDIEKYNTKPEHIEKVENTVLAFRLDFATHSVGDVRCHKIGDDNYIMNLHILDLQTAVFTEELSTLPTITSVTDQKSFYSKERKLNALIHYFTKFYFPVLKGAGLHVLHSLPDFDNLSSTSAHIDYSIISKTRLSTSALHGISIDEVNAYLKTLWLQAASYIDEHGIQHSDVTKTYLAELKSTWSESGEEYDIHIAFGPLQVQAICKREVFLIIDCQEVSFQSTITQKDHFKFNSWKLALIIDVDFEEVQSVRRLKLKLKSSRFCEPFSKLPGALADEDLLIRLKTTLVEFVQQSYLTILEKAHHYYVYHHDTRIETKSGGHSHPGRDFEVESGDESDDEDIGCDCTEDHACTHTVHGEATIKWRHLEHKRITQTTTTGFDQVSVITQGALNAHIKQLWEAARIRVASLNANVRTWSSKHLELETNLAEYGYAEGEHVFFRASFVAPKIQLLVKESGHHQALVYIQIREGFLKTLGNNKSLASGHSDNSFNNWRLAFTVNLKLIDASEETITDAILKLLGRQNKSSFKQLVLDLSHATFNTSESVLSGLMDSEDYVLIRKKREAIVHYIQHHYFPSLIAAGHHILYTIPMFDKAGQGNHFGSLTSIKFQLYPFSWGSNTDVVEGVWGKLSYLYERNMIVLLGMTDHHEIPHGWLPHGLGLIPASGSGESRGKISYGSITLSHKEFLDKYILTILNDLNKKTTILPSFSGIGKGGDWILKLTTWAKHEYKASVDCRWKIAEGADRSQANINGQELQWIWKNRDEWKYDHEGDLGHNGIYSIRCVTRNVLTIPTAYKRGGLSIIVSGHVDVTLSYEGDAGKWTHQMQAKWSGAIKLLSDAVHGLRLQVTPATVHPHFEKAHVHQGHVSETTVSSVYKQLQENIPSTIDFHSVANNLTLAFGGIKRNLITRSRDLVLVNPVFNRRGDLLLELTARQDAIVEEAAVEGGRPVPRGPAGVKRSESWFKHLKREVSEVFHNGKQVTTVTSSSSSTSLSRTSSQVSEKTVIGAQANGNGTTKQQPVKPATPQPAAQQSPVATKV